MHPAQQGLGADDPASRVDLWLIVLPQLPALERLAPYADARASVLAALFVLRFIPETKGRGLESIESLWGPAKPATAASAAE